MADNDPFRSTPSRQARLAADPPTSPDRINRFGTPAGSASSASRRIFGDAPASGRRTPSVGSVRSGRHAPAPSPHRGLTALAVRGANLADQNPHLRRGTIYRDGVKLHNTPAPAYGEQRGGTLLEEVTDDDFDLMEAPPFYNHLYNEVTAAEASHRAGVSRGAGPTNPGSTANQGGAPGALARATGSPIRGIPSSAALLQPRGRRNWLTEDDDGPNRRSPVKHGRGFTGNGLRIPRVGVDTLVRRPAAL